MDAIYNVGLFGTHGFGLS